MVRRVTKALKQAARKGRRMAEAAKAVAAASSDGRRRRAELRHHFLTDLPDRLSRGALFRQYRAMEVVQREWSVEATGWPSAFDGIRIGLVTDLHAGSLITPTHAAGIVERLRGSGVDLVACTGDVTDLHAADAKEPLDRLGSLEAPLGTYLVLGNHDALGGLDAVAAHARRAGVKVLRNHAAALRRGDQSLVVGGIEWGETLRACARGVDLSASSAAGRPHLLLAHNPKAFRRAAELSIPLTLSGHTHGGQVSLRPREHRFPKRAKWRKLHAGPYVERGAHLYVSSGAGSWFPLRVNRPPEVVVIQVRAVC